MAPYVGNSILEYPLTIEPPPLNCDSFCFSDHLNVLDYHWLFLLLILQLFLKWSRKAHPSFFPCIFPNYLWSMKSSNFSTKLCVTPVVASYIPSYQVVNLHIGSTDKPRQARIFHTIYGKRKKPTCHWRCSSKINTSSFSENNFSRLYSNQVYPLKATKIFLIN